MASGIRPRGFEPLTFGSGAENLIGRSCHFNHLTVVHSVLFRSIWAHLPPILPPGFAPEIWHRRPYLNRKTSRQREHIDNVSADGMAPAVD